MSASTRTVQQPLGISQLGAALIVVALAIAIAVAVALGSMGTKPTEAGAGAVVPEISVGVPPDARDHGWNAAIPQISVGVPPDAREGSSNSGTVITDTRGGFNGDPGLAPRGNEKTRVPGLRAE